ncbi:hypothetical protein HMPREF3156_00740 [Neisseria sp. HMSC06F02]|nr:hypothetical protein HMPREF3156_00740 [Neisseria sp. HMSC06F02]
MFSVSFPLRRDVGRLWVTSAHSVRLLLFRRAEAHPAFRLPEMVCRLLFQVA